MFHQHLRLTKRRKKKKERERENESEISNVRNRAIDEHRASNTRRTDISIRPGFFIFFFILFYTTRRQESHETTGSNHTITNTGTDRTNHRKQASKHTNKQATAQANTLAVVVVSSKVGGLNGLSKETAKVRLMRDGNAPNTRCR